MADTNKFLGSWLEGSDQLHSVCQDGQLLEWRAVSVSPENEVNITGFSGEMVSSKICTPSQQGITGDFFWEGQVETKGEFASYAYTVTLGINASPMSFSPFLKVV